MNRWTFPFSPDPYCKISVRGNEDWTWRRRLKASQWLSWTRLQRRAPLSTVRVCKSLHLPELLTSRGFYWSPLRAFLMCAAVYSNINILHMYRNIYSKQCRKRLLGMCLWVCFGWGQSELHKANLRTDVLRSYKQFHSSQAQTSVTISQILTQHFHASQTRERIKLNDCRWRIKGGTRFSRPHLPLGLSIS